MPVHGALQARHAACTFGDQVTGNICKWVMCRNGQPPEIRRLTHAAKHALQVAPCDRISVMHAGRIVDSGSHTELLARPGWYADTWRAQHAAAA